jgi:hypothetical protein
MRMDVAAARIARWGTAEDHPRERIRIRIEQRDMHSGLGRTARWRISP